MKKLIITLASVVALASALTANALDFSVNGVGQTQTQGAKNTGFGTEFRFEKFNPLSVSTNVSVAVVQGVSFTEPNVRGTTELLGAYNLNYSVFKLKNQAYVGVGSRVGYGNGDFTWTAGPVVGNRLFLRDNVYVLAQVGYDLGINRAADNTVRYTLGLGARF
jgi:hypothetical protein